MAITCKDILELPSVQKMKVVAGHKGLNNVVRWVHVADIPQVTDWVQGGELLFITGIGINRDLKALLKLVEAIQAKSLAGLVINVGPYIEEIPEEVIQLADGLNFPVFELPWEVKLVEVTQTVCRAIVTRQMEEKSIRDLLENILFYEPENTEMLINRAAYYGYDLTKPYQVLIVGIDDFSSYLKGERIQDEKRIVEIKLYLQQIVQEVIDKRKKKSLGMLRGDSVILLVQVKSGEKDAEIRALADEIRQNVAGHIPKLTVTVGIGNYFYQLTDFKKSLGQAEQALKVAKATQARDRTLSFQELGVYRLLYQVSDWKELEAFHREVLGLLLSYDKKYGTELVDTLEVYLAENGNLMKTADRLYLHRNTLKYRVQRIQEISGQNLQGARERLNFQVALMVGKFLNRAE